MTASAGSQTTPPLEQRVLGSTGLRVSPVCIGCAPLGNMPETFEFSVPEERALQTLRAIFQSPINFLDTAASYGDGESERRIGLALREMGGLPAGYVLATKADRDLRTGEFSGDAIKRSVERSLRLLGLDRLQIVHLHDPEHTTVENVLSRGGPLEVLQRLKEQGVIGHLGVAGGPTAMEIQYVETGLFELVITHNRYNLLRRASTPLLDIAFARGVAVLSAAPYGSGILAKGPDAYPRYYYADAPPLMVERARRMEAICARYGVPLAAAALQFHTRDRRIASTILGMSRPERVQQTLDLIRHPIPDELWPELDAVGYDVEE
jgi:D-threo-aldose 1-dehydrogenase